MWLCRRRPWAPEPAADGGRKAGFTLAGLHVLTSQESHRAIFRLLKCIPLMSLSPKPNACNILFPVLGFPETKTEILDSVKKHTASLFSRTRAVCISLTRQPGLASLTPFHVSSQSAFVASWPIPLCPLSLPLSHFENVKASYYKVYLGVWLLQKTGQYMNTGELHYPLSCKKRRTFWISIEPERTPDLMSSTFMS